jgi:hypothetical protein
MGRYPGKDVIQSGNIGRALNGGMSAQSQDAAAWTPDIAQQSCKNCRRADNLHTLGMLRPTYRVADRSGLFRSRSRNERFCCFKKYFFGDTAATFHHLRRVAREVTLQDLEDATRMLQRRIGLKLRGILGFATAIFAVSSCRRRMSSLGFCLCGRGRLARVSILCGPSPVQPRLSGSYFFFSESQPEKSPFRSSVSRKSSRRSVEALV